MATQRVEISYKTIVFTVLFLISLAVLWNIRNIIILFFLCFLFMEAINPLITRLEKFKIPRPLAIIMVYLLILVVLSFALASVVPIFVEQSSSLIRTLPDLLKNTTFFGTSAIDISSQFQILENLPSNVARAVLSVFSNVFSAFVIFVITFYLLLERKNIGKYSFDMFGSKGKQKAMAIVENLEKRLGNWVAAEILLMTVIGLLSYLGYILLGLNYTVPLAIIAGLLEVVPNIGPTVATAIAALVGLTISPVTALLTIGWGLLVQQLENNFIVPKIMKETVGLNPLVTILIIAVGAKLGGVLGAILGIPIFLTAEVIFKVLTDKT